MAFNSLYTVNKESKMLSIVPAFSGSGSAILGILDGNPEEGITSDPNYNKGYIFSYLITDNKNSKSIPIFEDKHTLDVLKVDKKTIYDEIRSKCLNKHNIDSTVSKGWDSFIKKSGRKAFLEYIYKDQYNDALEVELREKLRGIYDEKFFDELTDDKLKSEYGLPRIIILSGYMNIISDSLLNRLKDNNITILNIHPANLSELTSGEEIIDASDLSVNYVKELDIYHRNLIGDNPVYDALKNALENEEKEVSLYSTVHFVTPGVVDHGPIFVRSDELRVNIEHLYGADEEELKKFKDEVQEYMKWYCDLPAYKKALELISKGGVQLDDESGEVKVDDKILPYGGILMDGILEFTPKSHN